MQHDQGIPKDLFFHFSFMVQYVILVLYFYAHHIYELEAFVWNACFRKQWI